MVWKGSRGQSLNRRTPQDTVHGIDIDRKIPKSITALSCSSKWNCTTKLQEHSAHSRIKFMYDQGYNK